MRARPLAEPPVARRATGRMSGLRCMLLLAAAFCILGCVWASDTPSKEERERSNFSYIHKDLRRPQQYGMSTLADYPQLLAEDDDGQIIKTPETTEVPLDLPTIVLSDILPSTGFLVARDKFTNTILSNSTAFFVASDVVITAAHSVAPLLRRFHVNLQIITNSRTSGGSRTFNVTSIAYDNVNAPCQVLLQVNGNHSHTLPLSKHPAEDGSMVRVLSNSPIGFGGIHLDGLVSRVFDVWNEGTEQQCYRDRSISMYNWYCEQDKFLISTPTWPGASGSPVISATGVIGTVESTGPHTGTAIAASTHGLIIPPPASFVSLDSIFPALLCGESCTSDLTTSHHFPGSPGWFYDIWSWLWSLFKTR